MAVDRCRGESVGQHDSTPVSSSHGFGADADSRAKPLDSCYRHFSHDHSGSLGLVSAKAMQRHLEGIGLASARAVPAAPAAPQETAVPTRHGRSSNDMAPGGGWNQGDRCEGQGCERGWRRGRRGRQAVELSVAATKSSRLLWCVVALCVCVCRSDDTYDTKNCPRGKYRSSSSGQVS